jgi:two-component system, OmpR family, heavy metal sensor histidine kinase CusS
MKSIRLSLLVYFLVLLTAALAAVSWFSYQTTAQSLRQRKLDAQTLIETQCGARIKETRAALDRRLLRQAQTMLNLSQSIFVHAEGLWYPLGMLGSAVVPNGQYNLITFFAEGQNKKIAPELFRAQPLSTHIEWADELVVAGDKDHAQEYFQMYRTNGYPLQRSESLGERSFVLDESVRKSAIPLTESFDDIELQQGIKLRRVTLKAAVKGWRFVSIPGIWGRNVPEPMLYPTQWPKGGGRFQPPRSPVQIPKGAVTPNVFIQYATDIGPTEAKIQDFLSARDTQLRSLESSITLELEQLRNRMLWVSLIMLAAIWLGGFGVIQLGLAPLSRMSDAVSQVSPRNFHLSVDPDTLPNELQPIASRLQEVLLHLQQAFAREKQAAADISHELRTPLAALMTTLEVGLRKVRKPEEYREILQECQSSGQHMYQLVERLLTLARLDAGVDQYYPRQIDVMDITLQCADLIRPLAKARGIVLRLDLPNEITLQTDPDKLREVLVNLLHNAVEYNRPDGSIEISVKCLDDQVRIIVRDTGIGIKPEALGRIFERFYRADPSRHADTPHAGLGLSIVKSYVDLMGGSIKVDSSDAGTAFIIDLPSGQSAAPIDAAVTPANNAVELVR